MTDAERAVFDELWQRYRLRSLGYAVFADGYVSRALEELVRERAELERRLIDGEERSGAL
jgi:hypothetical protein